MKDKVVILGLGNTLQTDEGIGVHAVHYLERHRPVEHAEYIDGGTLSFNLVASITDTDRLIVVDTAELDAAPGSVQVFEGDDMDSFIAHARKTSAHEVGLKDALGMALLEGRLPHFRALVGIQPAQFGWSNQPTREVAAAIHEACKKISALSESWQS